MDPEEVVCSPFRRQGPQTCTQRSVASGSHRSPKEGAGTQVKGQIVTDCHTLPPALKLKVDVWDLSASHAVMDAGHGAGGGLPSATLTKASGSF